MNKKIITILWCFILSLGVKAQFSFFGTWDGVQTNMQGYYPTNIQFLLTQNREFDLIDKATNTIKYRGTYKDSGNFINGKYIETIGSTSYVHYFAGTYDPGTKKMSLTFGNSPANYWQGKWVVTKKDDLVGGLNDDRSYILQVAKVTLVTGNDNKDKGAELCVRVFPNNERQYQFMGYSVEHYTDELKKWQWQTLNLSPTEHFDESFNNLGWYKQYGVDIDIWYNSYGGPFPLTDAWKLDKVIVDLQFSTITGIPHPQYGKVHLEFPNSSVLFTATTCYLKLSTDGNFKPLNQEVRKDCK